MVRGYAYETPYFPCVACKSSPFGAGLLAMSTEEVVWLIIFAASAAAAENWVIFQFFYGKGGDLRQIYGHGT
jgi:hypothetical protein